MSGSEALKKEDDGDEMRPELRNGVSHQKSGREGGRGIQVTQVTIEMRAKVDALRARLKGMSAEQGHKEFLKVKDGDPGLYAAILALRDSRQEELRLRFAEAGSVRDAASQVDGLIMDELGSRAGHVHDRVKRTTDKKTA